MPSVSIHYGPERSLSERRFADLAEALAAAIEQRLGAKRDTIQIMAVPLAHAALGRPVYVEIKARDTEARGAGVLAAFIEEVDALTHRSFGVRCRIRYFRFPDGFLAAAN